MPRIIPEFRGIRKTFSSASSKSQMSADGTPIVMKENPGRRKPPQRTTSGCSTRSTGTQCTTRSCRSTRSFISTTGGTATSSTVTQTTISDEDAEWIVARTENKIGQTVSNSRFMQKNCTLARIPKLHHDELIVGDMIAQGGFSEVRTVSFIVDEEDESVDAAKAKLMSEMDKDGRPREYVIKHLSPKLVAKPKMLAVGAKDIVLEGFLLSSLNHENILKLEGHAAAGIQGLRDTGRADGYFLILPRLAKTLHTHLRDWAAEIKRMNSAKPKAVMGPANLNASVSSLGCDSLNSDGAEENDTSASEPRPDSSTGIETSEESPAEAPSAEEVLKAFQKEPFIFERLQTAVEITRAMWYLHDQRIIYRDLKPGMFSSFRGEKEWIFLQVFCHHFPSVLTYLMFSSVSFLFSILQPMLVMILIHIR